MHSTLKVLWRTQLSLKRKSNWRGKDIFALGKFILNGDKTPKKPKKCLGEEGKAGSWRLQIKNKKILEDFLDKFQRH